MIEIMYKKHHNKDLFKSLEKLGILNKSKSGDILDVFYVEFFGFRRGDLL